MEWQCSLKHVQLFRELQESYQLIRLLAKCLARSEPCHYITGVININEVSWCRP